MSLIERLFTHKKGTIWPIRKLLHTIKKEERTPYINEEANLWASVVACDDDTDSECDGSCTDSDMSTADASVCGGASDHDDLGCCGEPSALLLSEPVGDLDTDGGKL